jgi:hypothetical protein
LKIYKNRLVKIVYLFDSLLNKKESKDKKLDYNYNLFNIKLIYIKINFINLLFNFK